MSLTEPEIIKRAILHPQPAVRRAAVDYFADSHSRDASVMEAVIAAVRQYGRGENWMVLAAAQPLRQTGQTLDWAVEELRQPFEADDSAAENYHHAIAGLIAQTQFDLVADRLPEASSLPEQWQAVLDERRRLAALDWDACWTELEHLGRQVMAAGDWERTDRQQLNMLAEALARQGEGREQFVLDLVGRRFHRAERPLYEALEPAFIALAGRMPLENAIPTLVERLGDYDDSVGDAAMFALIRIGGDTVVQEIAHSWKHAGPYTRMGMAEALGHIPAEQAVEHCLAFLDREQDGEAWWSLAHATLDQMNRDAIERLVPRLRGDAEQMDAEQLDLRLRVVEVATIFDVRFPEYDDWYAEALEAPWAWPSYMTPVRLGDVAREEPALENVAYQLKVTLEGVEPPVWRRLRVPDCSLTDLHDILQIAMGWEDVHAWSFFVDDVEYADAEFAAEEGCQDASQTPLSMVLDRPGQRLTYIYDFGDEWTHRIEVERIEQPGPGQDGLDFPICVDGARACPPEDVGGPGGYAELLAALVDPAHERHEELSDRIGKFDPETFNLDEINDWFATMDPDGSLHDGFEDDREDEDDLFADDEHEDSVGRPAAVGLGSLAMGPPPEGPRFPVGTVALYGPDDRTTTKIAAAVIAAEDADPILDRWMGTGIADNPRVHEQIQAFFRRHGVQQVVVSDGNMGCPHEEGEDFPVGTDCPFCPYWRRRQ